MSALAYVALAGGAAAAYYALGWGLRKAFDSATRHGRRR